MRGEAEPDGHPLQGDGLGDLGLDAHEVGAPPGAALVVLLVHGRNLVHVVRGVDLWGKKNKTTVNTTQPILGSLAGTPSVTTLVVISHGGQNLVALRLLPPPPPLF